jgi:WD40 repeat protein
METIDASHLKFMTTSRTTMRKKARASQVTQGSCEQAAGGNVSIFRGHHDHVIDVSVHRTITATASLDMAVRLWDVQACEQLAVLVGNEGLELSCVTILSATTLITGDQQGELQVWDIPSGAVKMHMPGHTGGVTCTQAIDESLFVSGADDGMVMVWSADTGECELELKGHHAGVQCCTVISTSRMASGDKGGGVCLWDLSDLASDLVIWKLQAHDKAVNALAITADNSMLCTGSSDSTIKVWMLVLETDGGMSSQPHAPLAPMLHLSGHQGRVMTLTVLTNGLLASGGLDCTSFSFRLYHGVKRRLFPFLYIRRSHKLFHIKSLT